MIAAASWNNRRGYGTAGLKLHFTPTSASWLNQVERVFAKITTQRICRDTFENVHALELAITTYVSHHNERCQLFAWTATADAIVNKIKRFCQRTSDTRLERPTKMRQRAEDPVRLS